MDELEQYIRNIDQSLSRLAIRFQEMEKAHKNIINAGGRGDVNELADQFRAVAQTYTTARNETVTLLRHAQKSLITYGTSARARGIRFTNYSVDSALNGADTDYDVQQIKGLAEQFKLGVKSLAETLCQFLATQIDEALRELNADYDRLERLGAHTAEYTAQRDALRARNAVLADNPTLADVGLRETLLYEVRTQSATYRQIARRALEDQILDVEVKGGALLGRLTDLQARDSTEEQEWQQLENQALLADRDLLVQLDMGEVVWNNMQVRLDHFQQRLDQVRTALGSQVVQLTAEAKDLLISIHPQMPESQALTTLLSTIPKAPATIADQELIALLADLTTHIVDAQNAGANALQRYEDLTAADPEYRFASQQEIDAIGTALITTAATPDQYTGRLWDIGGDILLRVMLSNSDAQQFYSRFGYPTVIQALNTALEQNNFIRALSFLNTDFLPIEGATPADSTRVLLAEPTLAAIFKRAAGQGALRLDPQQFRAMEPRYKRAMLTFLELSADGTIATSVWLQWAALLQGDFPPTDPLHRKATDLLLQGLLKRELYPSMYYTLHALADVYPELWQAPVFRPMLRHVVSIALDLGAEGRQFLLEVCTNARVARLAARDFGYEFMLATLLHFAAVRWGQDTLINQTWDAWDRLLGEEYPTLAEVLKDQVTDGQSSIAMLFNRDQVRKEYDQLVSLLPDRLVTPGLKGVRLAGMIHRWFISEYMTGWLQLLQNPQLSLAEVQSMLAAIRKLQQTRDLIEICPYQQNPPDGLLRPIHYPLKETMNGRLFDLLTLFQQAAMLRQQLLTSVPHHNWSLATLQKEIIQIREQSEMVVWSIDRMLKPDLLPA